MKFTGVVTLVNGHTAATANGKRLVFTPQQLRENDCVSCGRDRIS